MERIHISPNGKFGSIHRLKAVPAGERRCDPFREGWKAFFQTGNSNPPQRTNSERNEAQKGVFFEFLEFRFFSIVSGWTCQLSFEIWRPRVLKIIHWNPPTNRHRRSCPQTAPENKKNCRCLWAFWKWWEWIWLAKTSGNILEKLVIVVRYFLKGLASQFIWLYISSCDIEKWTKTHNTQQRLFMRFWFKVYHVVLCDTPKATTIIYTF